MQVVMNLCEHAAPEAVIVDELEQARGIVDAHPRVPVVLACLEQADADLLLDALRSGVSDVWTLPMADAALAERLEAVSARHRAVASDAERRLGRAISDLERDQRAGRYIQLGMLPPNPMAIDGYRLQHHILPSLILSGDFVDYFRISDRHFAFYVADVSGHGASSAFVTVLLKNFSRRLRREFRPSMLVEPGEILEWINRELLEQDMDKHVALLLGVGDLVNDEIRLVNGGHYPPAILNRAGASEFVEQKGKPVGLFDEVAYTAQVIRLEPGDRLVMFSDGVLDVMGAGDLSGKEQRLLRAASEGGSVEEMWSLLDMDLNVGNRPDDMTCLVVQRET
ncbi:MAG: SpoIIE family protein phosphatase [Pseudomonadales bacterium]